MSTFRFMLNGQLKPFFSRLLFVSSSVLLATALTGCEQAQQSAPKGMQPAAVSVMSMTTQSVPFSIELPATLSGAKEVEIRAQVSGILQTRNFSEGDKVTAGQSLFSLDAKTYAAEMAKSKADLNAATVRLEQAQREVNRIRPLREKNSISQRELDNAISSADINLADVKSMQADLEQAKLRLDYTKVISPVTGIVGRELVSEGTYVSGPEVLLTQLTQIDPIRVRFGLSEREQLQMRNDEAAGLLTLPEEGHWNTRIKLFDGSLHPQVGQVNFSDIRINSQTGTSELQAITPNPNFSLRPGQFVRIILEGAVRENAYVVPQRAVLDNGLGKFVYVMAKNDKGMTVALPAPVVVGEWVTEVAGIENGWIIREGLKTGDQVIIDGMARIFFPGMPIRLADDQLPSAAQQ
ncbi:efflux RND transporter periplasmic adaptor subunit [Colwellia psychrerythraea]|uniref:Efflux transporter, MFP subunit, AcrA/E family n=1 Tax=Colwellia psychrerythraea (strain 34H / ATCC BAA-681) TaxID=167879 RepID=Q486B6_COLP3|nr:efflux RND transporter periplasmic adaptor subunit [Colwellia psychrerythraea]AAZ24426.1 efflux transporter, MFP subunit, AcrA/E family [Colwellia psychrerythraea 34H]